MFLSFLGYLILSIAYFCEGYVTAIKLADEKAKALKISTITNLKKNTPMDSTTNYAYTITKIQPESNKAENQSNAQIA